MSRETHVRFCERLERRFLRATLRNVYVGSMKAGQRVMALLGKPQASDQRSQEHGVGSAFGRKFLGYALWVAKGREVKSEAAWVQCFRLVVHKAVRHDADAAASTRLADHAALRG